MNGSRWMLAFKSVDALECQAAAAANHPNPVSKNGVRRQTP